MIFVQSSLIRPKQIRLTELFTVERILASRGFRVLKEGNGCDTMLGKETWSGREADLVFDVFDDRTKRWQLLRLANREAVGDVSPNVCELVNSGGFHLSRDAFSRTFEWYVGELLVRRFGAFPSSYGVEVADIKRNSDGGTSGDFDVLSVLGSMEFLYVECKEGGFDRSKIFNIFERARSLHVLV